MIYATFISMFSFMTTLAQLESGARQAFESHQRGGAASSVFTMSSEQRRPSILLFSCSDSRVDPQVIFGTSPGDIYHHRVPGNIAVPAGTDDEGQRSASLAVDHLVHSALEDMEVEVIAILGHSECSTIESLVDSTATPSAWARLAGPIQSRVDAHYSPLSPSQKAVTAVAEHVRLQREQLLARVDVRQALKTGRLKSVEGFVYELGPEQKGSLSRWDAPSNSFTLVAGYVSELTKPKN